MTHATMRPGFPGSSLIELALRGRPVGSVAPLLVEVNRRALRGFADDASTEVPGDGEVRVEGALDGSTLHAVWQARRIASADVWELSLELRNDGDEPVTVTRMDPLAISLERGPWHAAWYRSAWGDEFRAESGTTRHDIVLEVRSGRSSHGMSPWLGLTAEDGTAGVVIAPAWSGNWHIHALSGGHITAGISPWQFAVVLAPGEHVTAPSVVVAAADDLAAATVQLQAAVRDDWLARTAFADTIPVEWNHWWPYEDAEVTEEVISENARIASDLGFQVATVDAGWFGAADSGSDWQEQRGDWDRVNTERFPSGLEALGESIRGAGVEAGMWIEAEAVGRSARLRAEHGELLALAVDGRRHDPSYRLTTVSLDQDDPRFLGYVCLGSAAGRAHVLHSMSSLIERTGARWIKLDFNIDPDAGCTRTDHGHGAADGLFRHVQGLYAVLDEVRRRHPDIVLESCSSGGLRIDLELARHVHCFFLSDPDYTEHALKVLFGASRLLPPLGILHWSQSQWRGDYPPQQLDWASLEPDAFDTMLRAAMLHRFGVSVRLPELAPVLLERLRTHVALFRQRLAPLVRTGVLRPLTAAPQGGGVGERAPALQLTGGAGGDATHVVAAFVLEGGHRPDAVKPVGLEPDRRYRLLDLAGGQPDQSLTGAALSSAGIPLAGRSTVTSWLFALEPERA
jgi:alpha-galactosidase